MADREEIICQAKAEFAFLEQMDGCEIELDEASALLTTVAYKFTSVAIELTFDWRDLDVACYIARVINGRRPDGYLLNDGERIRLRLGDLTSEVLTQFRLLPRPPKRRPQLEQWALQQSERMNDYVRIYARIVGEQFAELRSKAETAFGV